MNTGTIKCLVKNALAEIQREVQLEITGEQRPAKIIEKSQSKEVNAGESVEFFAKITGTPAPKVTWTRKGMPIESNEFYQLRTENDTYYLAIKNAIADVVGTYVVNAVNTAGKDSAEINLNIAGRICSINLIAFALFFRLKYSLRTTLTRYNCTPRTTIYFGLSSFC